MSVLAKQEAMIRIHDKQCIFPQIQLVHDIQHFPKMVITHGEQGRITMPHALYLVIRFLHGSVSRPIVSTIPDQLRIQVAERFRTVERFVRIERLQLQEPAFLTSVAADEVDTQLKGLCLRKLLLGNDVFAIDPVVMNNFLVR
ncbi:hypothetical protein D1872_254620 [compost metagenome]